MNSFINRDIRINNNQELKEIIPVLKNLINEYYERPNVKNERPIDALNLGALIQVQAFYKKQFKHEMEQTDRLWAEVTAMMTEFWKFNEKHKNKHRRLEFRTNV
jgi:hypothetical protein